MAEALPRKERKGEVRRLGEDIDTRKNMRPLSSEGGGFNQKLWLAPSTKKKGERGETFAVIVKEKKKGGGEGGEVRDGGKRKSTQFILYRTGGRV